MKSLGFGYVVRLKRNVYIYCKHYNGSFEKLTSKPDTLRDMDVTLLTAKNRYSLSIIIFFADGQ